MGNRAVITTPKRDISLYLHWNGGRDSIEGFLKYCDLRGFRPPSSDSYGWARLAQVISNFFGGGLSIGIAPYTTDEQENPGDNGIYIIDGWNIVDRVYPYVGFVEQQEYDLRDFLIELDSTQPVQVQLGENYIVSALQELYKGECGNCAWEIDKHGTLTISPIPETDGKLAEWDCEVMNSVDEQFGWLEYRDKIESVVVEPGVVAPTSCYEMFYNCQSLEDINGLANLDTSKVEDMRGIFRSCTSLTNLDVLASWDTSKVEDMSWMFSFCKSLTNVDLSGWDMSSVQSAEGMFWRCSNLQSVVGPEELVTKAELLRELWIPNKPKGLADKTLEVADLATEPVDQNLSTENLSRE